MRDLVRVLRECPEASDLERLALASHAQAVHKVWHWWAGVPSPTSQVSLSAFLRELIYDGTVRRRQPLGWARGGPLPFAFRSPEPSLYRITLWALAI